MTYSEAIEFLNSRKSLGIKPGLERVKALLERFDSPEQGLPCIHVAGTNGKGSTSMFLSHILIEAGYKTGLFTSPFIASPCEMFRVNNQPITQEEFTALIEEAKGHCHALDKLLDQGPTEYEIYAVIALVCFKRSNCQLAVIEACMGGRFDCTNVLSQPEVCVITKLSLEHQQFLGSSLEEIAWHKVGILKEGAPLVTYPQHGEAMSVIHDEALKLQSEVFSVDLGLIQIRELKRTGLTFDFEGLKSLRLCIPALYQTENAVLAIKSCELLIKKGWSISESAVRQGLAKARWPGRFEFLFRQPDFILDCCHNPDGVEAFVRSFQALYGDKKAVVLFGAMKDKDCDTMIKSLSCIAKAFVPVQSDNPRALPVQELHTIADKYCEFVIENDTIKDAVTKSLAAVEKDGIICALGSHFHAESVIKALRAILEGSKC
ncbi:MAG: bifunctional folylpolyglutamate synthase/dihydrofolate synthase [Clostridia bacterium]|nr:bifunctional folylpolyglutamate synthase/dihydrofolate synthase [Clostridia bacterium]